MFVVKYRSIHQRCSIKKGVLRNFAKFKGKHLCQRLFFNKVAGLTSPDDCFCKYSDTYLGSYPQTSMAELFGPSDVSPLST